MADLEISKRDKGFLINFTVQDSAGAAYNLTDYTIKLKVWSPNSPTTLKVNGTCTPIIAASGTCYYAVVAGDFDNVDDYNAEIELTKTDIIESTKKFTISVKESG